MANKLTEDPVFDGLTVQDLFMHMHLSEIKNIKDRIEHKNLKNKFKDVKFILKDVIIDPSWEIKGDGGEYYTKGTIVINKETYDVNINFYADPSDIMGSLTKRLKMYNDTNVEYYIDNGEIEIDLN